MIRSTGFAIFLMGLMLGTAAPLSADEYGVVDGINRDQRYVVIDDSIFYLDSASRLNTAEAEGVSWLNLRVGNKVKLTARLRSEDRQPAVDQMWILPASEPLPAEEED